MRHVFYKNAPRNHGGVEITGIKSTHYHEQCNTDGVLKFGNIIASSIDVEYYFGSQADLAVGDSIWYYQYFDYDQRDFTTEVSTYIFVNVFYVDSFFKSKKTARFVAYDITKKFDIDYSQRLLANKSNFPMTVGDLVDDIENYTGVTISISIWASGIKNALVNYFYVDGLTVRSLLSQIFEIMGYDAIARISSPNGVDSPYISTISYSDNVGSIGNTRYAANKYIISPTDQATYIADGNTLVPCFYKENGLNVSDDVYNPVDCVKVVKLDGTVLGYSGNTENNVYYVFNNVVSEHIDAFANSTALNGLLANVRAVNESPRVSANMFPFRFPFETHGITYFVDIDGTIKRFPIMNIDWTDERVLIESYGASVQSYQNYITNNTESQNAVATSVLNNLSEQTSQNTTDISNLQTIVGDGQLDQGFVATDLTDAANELLGNVDDVSGMISDAYDDTATYNVGDYCIYNNTLYECTTAVTSAESFDPSKWASATIASAKVSKSGDTVTGNLTVQGNLSLSNPLGIANGGSGQNGTSTEATAANIITSASGFTISTAVFKQWGKVAQVYLIAKKTTAQTSDASMTVGTLVNGKRPPMTTGGVCTSTTIRYTTINSSGTLSAYGTWAANAEKTIAFTYILP